MSGVSRKKGEPPGSLVHIGTEKPESFELRVTRYNEKSIKQWVYSELPSSWASGSGKTFWLHLFGVGDPGVIGAIGERWKLHPLQLEDIMNTNQRPKIDYYDNNLFITFRLFRFGEEQMVVSEQLSLALGKNDLLFFQESSRNYFSHIYDRLKHVKGRIRKHKVDYLAYALLDVAVDNYYQILEKLGDEIDTMEQDAVVSARKETLENIHRLSGEILYLRKYVRPMREMVAELIRTDSPFIRKTTVVYLKDLHDHISQIYDTLENFREILASQINTYLSMSSVRMNEVMKILTMFTTVFIPMTFVSGVYGMNFEYMPELHFRWAYPAVWGVMGLIFVSMMWFFKKKRWI